MGKQKRMFGLPKPGRSRDKNEAVIRAKEMLLDAIYDKDTRMFVKRLEGVAQQWGYYTHWTAYYDISGRELTLGEAKRRMAEAEKRRILNGTRHTRKYAHGSFSKSIWGKKLYQSHSLDAMQYAMMNQLPSEVTVNEELGARPVGGDTIRVARSPDVLSRK